MSRKIADFRSVSAGVTIVTIVTNTLFRRRSGRGDRSHVVIHHCYFILDLSHHISLSVLDIYSAPRLALQQAALEVVEGTEGVADDACYGV